MKSSTKKTVVFTITAEVDYYDENDNNAIDLEAFANNFYSSNKIKEELEKIFDGNQNFAVKSYINNFEFGSTVGKHITD